MNCRFIPKTLYKIENMNNELLAIKRFVESLQQTKLNGPQQSILLVGTDGAMGSGAYNRVLCDNSINTDCMNKHNCSHSKNKDYCSNGKNCKHTKNTANCNCTTKDKTNSDFSSAVFPGL